VVRTGAGCSVLERKVLRPESNLKLGNSANHAISAQPTVTDAGYRFGRLIAVSRIRAAAG